jgi:ribonuclease HI
MQIKAYIELIWQHLFIQPADHRRESTQVRSWAPLPEGTTVLNVDAALFASTERMGVGIVIRDHNGLFLAACSQVLDKVTVPELAEALAIRSAVTLAREEGLDKITLVSDCLSVIQRLKAPSRDRSTVGVVVEDIKIIAQTFSAVAFRHVNRQCNNSAHTLARRAELFGFAFFRNCAPDFIRDKLCIDII